MLMSFLPVLGSSVVCGVSSGPKTGRIFNHSIEPLRYVDRGPFSFSALRVAHVWVVTYVAIHLHGGGAGDSVDAFQLRYSEPPTLPL